MKLWLDADKHQWHSRHAAPLPNDVVELSFIVAYAGAHLALQ